MLFRSAMRYKVVRNSDGTVVANNLSTCEFTETLGTETLSQLLNLPWRLSKEQISWLKNRMKDKRPEVRALAKEQYEMRFPPKRLEDIEDDFIE